MRLFSAIPFPEVIKNKVREITRGRLPVPYINTTYLHITLNFFGDLDTDQTKLLTAAFPTLPIQNGLINIEFDKLVKFHNQIHLTIKDNPILKETQTYLEDFFESKGFTFQNREYYPHVKLANMHLDNVMNRDRKIQNFPNEELRPLNFQAEKIILYESKLLLHHPHHYQLAEIKL